MITHIHTHTHPMRTCQRGIGANRKSSKWPKLEQISKKINNSVGL